MRWLDRALQRWRFLLARPWIPAGSRVLDIGTHQGELLRSLGGRIQASLGLDPLARPQQAARFRVLPARFEVPAPFRDASFDVVVLLATLEHVPEKEGLIQECHRLVRRGGRVIVTVPSPYVDHLIAALSALRLLDGMSLEQHHGFDPAATPSLFLAAGFSLEHSQRFQLGLNHLFVFNKPLRTAGPARAAAVTPSPNCRQGGPALHGDGLEAPLLAAPGTEMHEQA